MLSWSNTVAKCCETREETQQDAVARTVFCPVSTTINLIGGKYKPLIIWNLFEGPKRYSQLHRAISQATSKMLTQQLRELENDGLVERTIFPVIPPRVEYSLTELGESLKPVLRSIYRWGKNYLDKQGIDPNCGMTIEETAGSGQSVPACEPQTAAAPEQTAAADPMPSVTLVDESTEDPTSAQISIPTLLPPGPAPARKKTTARRKPKAEPRPDELGHMADLFG